MIKLTLDEIQAIATAVDAGVRATGIQALQNPALGEAVRKLQAMADAEAEFGETDDG